MNKKKHVIFITKVFTNLNNQGFTIAEILQLKLNEVDKSDKILNEMNKKTEELEGLSEVTKRKSE